MYRGGNHTFFDTEFRNILPSSAMPTMATEDAGEKIKSNATSLNPSKVVWKVSDPVFILNREINAVGNSSLAEN